MDFLLACAGLALLFIVAPTSVLLVAMWVIGEQWRRDVLAGVKSEEGDE